MDHISIERIAIHIEDNLEKDGAVVLVFNHPISNKVIHTIYLDPSEELKLYRALEKDEI